MTDAATVRSGNWRRRPAAVLVSGGVDSAVLVGELAETAPLVVPIYLRTGMIWEDAEEEHLRRFLAALAAPTVRDVVRFELSLRDVYGEHWSTTGQRTPDAASADAAVFLPGRNLLLLVQPLLWCQRHGIESVALALLAGNPFPDSTPRFFQRYERLFELGAGSRVRIRRPYARLTKEQVVQRGVDMPLEHTFSCIGPVNGLHCGRCNKCAERQRGFVEAGCPDRTVYHA